MAWVDKQRAMAADLFSFLAKVVFISHRTQITSLPGITLMNAQHMNAEIFFTIFAGQRQKAEALDA